MPAPETRTEHEAKAGAAAPKARAALTPRPTSGGQAYYDELSQKGRRLTDKRRKRPLPTGKVCRQLTASPTKIREFFEKLADGGDAGKANGDPAGEMTTDGVVELSRGRRRPDR